MQNFSKQSNILSKFGEKSKPCLTIAENRNESLEKAVLLHDILCLQKYPEIFYLLTIP